MKVAVVGEAMLELVPTTDKDSRTAQMQHLVAAFAGDTYNTAIYLARLGSEVCYCTLVGDDPYSRLLISNTRHEGIDVELMEALPDRQLGLYMIRNLAGGEREFRYWRSEAPAREMFVPIHFGERQQQVLLRCPNLYLSGISIAILKEDGRQHLLEFLQRYRQQGGQLYFDSNYRPRLWQSSKEAREWIHTILNITDIALLTLDDQQTLWEFDNSQDAIDHSLNLNCREVIIKHGHLPAIGRENNETFTVDTPEVQNVIDTTGAGDSFNAGYIHARLAGKTCVDAITQANRCASLVIQHRGAIIPKEKFIEIWAN